MTYFFTPPFYAHDFDVIGQAIAIWCQAHDCQFDSEKGKRIFAVAIDMYSSGVKTIEQLSAALLLRLPPRTESEPYAARSALSDQLANLRIRRMEGAVSKNAATATFSSSPSVVKLLLMLESIFAYPCPVVDAMLFENSR